jgi:hypothetical protein
MGSKHIPLEINEDGLVTKVGNDTVGSNKYTTTQDGKTYDNCVVCGNVSPYVSETHIDYRVGYVEGGGQACYQPDVCITSNANERELITIPKYLIEKYPNNIELGAAIRAYYWEHYK